MDNIKSCHYCKAPFPEGTHGKRKYCKGKNCKARAYEKRHNLTTPFAINTKSYTYRTPTAIEGRSLVRSGYGEHIELLQLQLNHWINEHNNAMNGIFSLATITLATTGAVVTPNVVVPKANKKRFKTKSEKQQIAAASIIGGLVGAITGAQIDKSRKEKAIIYAENKVKELKRELNKAIETDRVLRSAIASKKIDSTQSFLRAATSLTGAQLVKMKFETLDIKGKYSTLLGDVSRGFNMAIFGAAGSGKSTVAIDLSKDLKEHGRVIYFAAEEGLSKSLSKKVEMLNATSPYINYSTIRSFGEIVKQINSDTKFVVLDSIERVNGITPTLLNGLYKKHPEVSFISILQANKDGNYKGESSYVHDIDILWKVKKLSVWNEKNRFGGSGTVALDLGGNGSGKRITRGF